MSAEISSLVASIGLASNMARALVDERDRQKAATLQADLTKQILDTQIQLSHVLATAIAKDSALHALGERVRELEAAQAEKARYRLAKVGTFGSFFAYELRAAGELADRNDEPHHFLCQACFDAGKKSVLRFAQGVCACSLCSSAVRVEATPVIGAGRVVRAAKPRDW